MKKILLMIMMFLMFAVTANATEIIVKFPCKFQWEFKTDRHLEVPFILKVKNEFWQNNSRVEIKCRFSVELSESHRIHTEVIKGNPKVVNGTVQLFGKLHIDNYDREYIISIRHDGVIGNITPPPSTTKEKDKTFLGFPVE